MVVFGFHSSIMSLATLKTIPLCFVCVFIISLESLEWYSYLAGAIEFPIVSLSLTHLIIYIPIHLMLCPLSRIWATPCLSSLSTGAPSKALSRSPSLAASCQVSRIHFLSFPKCLYPVVTELLDASLSLFHLQTFPFLFQSASSRAHS